MNTERHNIILDVDSDYSCYAETVPAYNTIKPRLKHRWL